MVQPATTGEGAGVMALEGDSVLLLELSLMPFLLTREQYLTR
jgi:hypothetical protein